jgi:N-acetylmuramoyl-L-alanine amidase
MRKVHLEFFSFVLLLGFATLLLSAPFSSQTASLPHLGDEASPKFCVILDAGHGGEDGGTVGVNGAVEKELNLIITMMLGELLSANGIKVIYTRTTDTLLYDKTVDFHGRKKALDLAARREIAEETPNCIFVSIHMNSYPIEKYFGQQIWYSPNNALSKTLAEVVKDKNQTLLQPYNTRTVKPASSAIYLLHHLTVPSILIECGFLSNTAECQALSSPEYQKELAFTLFLGISEWLAKNSP